jgi:uncharacterized membrane protein YgdD (TMEM256/DUF423 family)
LIGSIGVLVFVGALIFVNTANYLSNYRLQGSIAPVAGIIWSVGYLVYHIVRK